MEKITPTRIYRLHNMNRPKVAIIIPNYNKAKYLSDCINSALNQTYKNIEIIIVDDHSTDKSDEIIKNFAKKHPSIKYYRLPENKGVSHARNFGAQKTSADYLVFLDSDDVYINTRKIENEVKLARKNRIVFSQWVPMEKTGEVIPYRTYFLNPLRGPFAICKILSIHLPPYKQLRGYMIPVSLFKKINGYNTKLQSYEDFDLQCRLALNAKIAYTRETGEAYRLNTGGLSAKNEKEAQNIIKSVRAKYYRHLNPFQRIVFNFYLRRKNDSN